MAGVRGTRAWIVAALLAFVGSAGADAALVFGPPKADSGVGWAVIHLLLLPSLLFALAISVRRPDSPVGPALAWLGATPSIVSLVEDLGGPVGSGFWVWNLTGLMLVCTLFPDGFLPERRWQLLPYLAGGAALIVNVVIATSAPIYADAGAGVLLVAAIVACCACPFVRYRAGSETTRLQLRWLLLGVSAVPLLMIAGWALEAAGASITVSYAGFMLALVVGVPVTVAIAVLRYDLLDIDRLLSSSATWLLTTLLTAGVFALVVATLAEALHATTSVGVVAAAFVAALCLAPIHQVVQRVAGRVLDRDRFVIADRINEFVRRVRDGHSEPEAVEPLLRDVLGDPGARLVLTVPGVSETVGVDGTAWDRASGAAIVPLRTGDTDVGALVLSVSSARRLRRAREAVLLARLPIEVSRLRLQLRLALDDARSSRARLARAVAEERRKLERDLHDGAQQQVVAVGMRLRSTQRMLDPRGAAFAEIDRAVEALEQIVSELRMLAHGVRPSRLDDGLPVALRALAAESAVPVELTVEDVQVPEEVATTIFYVVSESLVNAHKHGSPGQVSIRVARRSDRVVVDVADDGSGGASNGFGITSLRDRVASVGGVFEMTSPIGCGTAVHVEI